MKTTQLLFLRKLCWLVVFVVASTTSISVYAKNGSSRKVQEVNFDETDVSGSIRRPEGLYMVQKRNIDFVPLYKVREQFDRNIKDSVEYMR